MVLIIFVTLRPILTLFDSTQRYLKDIYSYFLIQRMHLLLKCNAPGNTCGNKEITFVTRNKYYKVILVDAKLF